MSDGLDAFNALPTAEAEDELFGCFANRRWSARIVSERPYHDFDDLMSAADAAWLELSDTDWLQSFAAHPRIGERGGHAPKTSEREQSRVMQAPDETLAALAEENREYEKRFGHVFLIAASGRSADEILQEMRRRLSNDAATELRVAAEEQRKITRLRLEKLLKT